MLTKYTNVEEILEVKSSNTRLPAMPGQKPGTGLSKFAALNDMQEEDGYLYVRCRAISSRVNKNNDGWPSQELAASYKSFLGRPIFVDHNNDDPKRTRGVIIDSKLHVEDEEKESAFDPYYSTAPDNHKPPTWIELLLEVDAKTYPKFAEAIRKEEIDSVSMGANIDKSVCSVCSNEAMTPAQYCSHIKQKGITFEIEGANGEKQRKKAYEDCHGITFFEISGVFDPADETALISDKVGKTAALPSDSFIEPYNPDSKDKAEDDRNYTPQDDQITAPQQVDTLRDERMCPVCHSDHLATDPDGIERCPTCGHVQEPEPLNNPDLGIANDTDLRQLNEDQPNVDGENQVPVNDGGDTEGVTFQPSNGVQSVEPINRATNSTISNQGIDEMNWEVTLETTSKAMADKVLPAKAASTETTLGYADGISFATHTAFKQAGIQAQVRYPVDGDNTNVLPGNPLKDFALINRAMAALNLESPADVPVQVTSSNLEDSVALIQSGGTQKSAASRKDKQALLPSGKSASDEPRDQKVVSDQPEPVTSKVRLRNDKGDLVEVAVENGQLVVSSVDKEADRRHIKREEREEDGAIVRSEEIVEESGDDPQFAEEPVAEDEGVEPEADAEAVEETEDQREPVAASVDPEKKLLSIFSLADELVDLGIVSRESKMLFVSELEAESDEVIEGRKRMLAAVQQAGLSRKPGKVAGTGLNRVPRLSHSVVPSGNGSIDSIPDEALFV